mgnify:CR=1 FL=1
MIKLVVKHFCLFFILVFLILFINLPLISSQGRIAFEGKLQAIIGDPINSGEESFIFYSLFSNNSLYEIVPSIEIPYEYIGKNVRIEGTLNGNIIYAQLITLLGSEDAPIIVTGPQNTISFLVKFNDQQTNEPFPISYFTNFLFGSYPSLKTLWEFNSYNLLNLINSGISGWFTLPSTQAQYGMANTTFPNGGNLYVLLNDSLAAANNAGTQVQNNMRVLLFVNNWTGCCAFGSVGFFTVPTPYGSRTISISWNPIWAYDGNGLHVVGHEYGHNLGFWHSGNVYAPYDSPWDTVSAGCNPEGADTIAKNKIDSTWLSGSDIITIASTQFVQTTIYPITDGNGVRAVKITTPDPNIYFTIESRRKVGHDICLPNEGIIIHKVNVSLGDWSAKPVDATPGDNNLANAQWNIGQAYNNTDYQFSIQVVSSQANNGTILQVVPQGTFSSQCGTISSPGYYTLSNNVFSPGTCFTINSDNVNLDCQGNTITYGISSPGFGVTATNKNNIVIRNCNINQGSPQGSSHAVKFDVVNQAQVLNSNINTIGVNSFGIYDLGNSQVLNHLYENNIITTSGAWSSGIEVISGGNNIIRSNNITTTGSNTKGVLVSTNNINTDTIVSQNRVFTSGLSSIGVEIGTKNTNVTSNLIKTTSNYSRSLIVFGYDQPNNYLFNNSVETSGISSKSLYVSHGGTTIVKNLFKTTSASNTYGIEFGGYTSTPNIIYNNIFNVTGNLFLINSPSTAAWNTTYQQVINIVGGPYLGGNFYARTNGAGFSETCADVNFNGICDAILQHSSQNIDYLPLTRRPPIVATIQGSPNLGAVINISLRDSFHPGSYYILGASLSTQPPIVIGPPYATSNIVINLAQDFVFDTSISNPQSIGLSNSQGLFNQNGEAIVTFQIPNISSLAGVTVYFAFATFNVSALTSQVVATSGSVPVTFLP